MAVSNERLLTEITGVKVSVAKMEVHVADLYKEVKGNGKPGLIQRMNDIENCFGDHAKNQEKSETTERESKKNKVDFGSKVWLAVIVMIISNIGAILFSLFK